MTFQVTKSLKLIAEVEYLDDMRPPDSGIVAIGTGIPPIAPGSSYSENLAYNDVQTVTARYEVLYTAGEHVSFRHAYRNNQTNEGGDEVTVTGVSANNLLVNRRVSRTSNWVDNLYTQNDLILNFKTGGARHNLLLGFEYGWNDSGDRASRASLATIAVTNPVRGLATPGAFTLFSDTRSKVWFRESYIQDQVFLFNDHLTLLGGVRYANSGQRTNNYLTSVVARTGSADPNPRLGAVWLPGAGFSLFAVQTAILVPGTSSDPDGTTFDPVESKLTEVGLRAELMGKRFVGTVSFFDITQTNVLVPDPARVGFRLQTGERTSRGVEIDLTANPMRGWQILGAISLTKAEVSADTVIKVGNKLPNTPAETFSLWNKYTVQSGQLAGLGMGAGVISVAKRWGDDTNTFTVDPYTRVDLSLDYRWKRWLLGVNLRNALNTDYIEASSSRLAVRPGAPRNFLAQLRYRF